MSVRSRSSTPGPTAPRPAPADFDSPDRSSARRGDLAPQRPIRFACAIALTVLALACCALYLMAERDTSALAGFPLDDTWIHLQFARNLHHGEGLAYREGNLVSGSTSPLWAALLSFVFALPGPLILWVKLLGIAFHLAGAALTYALARELDLPPPAAFLVALLYALTDALVWSALSGMEIPLFVCLSVGGTILHLRERRAGPRGRPSLALVTLGLAALARPEGLALLALAVADRLLFAAPGTTRRAALPGLAIGVVGAAVLIGAHQVFSVVASGSPLPTTFAVKTDGIVTLLPSGPYLLRVVGILFRPHPVPTLLALAGALLLLERLGTRRDRGLLPAFWLTGLPLAYSLLDSPQDRMIVGNFGRYFFPLFPFVLVLAAIALEQPARRLAESSGRWRWPAAAVLAAILLVPPVSSLISGSRQYGLAVRNVNESDVAMALWVRAHLPADAVLAVQDIGAVGFFTPNPLLDLAGIVSPEILHWTDRASGGGRRGLVRFLRERRPEYLMFFADRHPGLLEELGAVVVHRLRVERNVTMAGADLVLARGSWGRAGGVEQGSP